MQVGRAAGQQAAGQQGSRGSRSGRSSAAGLGRCRPAGPPHLAQRRGAGVGGVARVSLAQRLHPRLHNRRGRVKLQCGRGRVRNAGRGGWRRQRMRRQHRLPCPAALPPCRPCRAARHQHTRDPMPLLRCRASGAAPPHVWLARRQANDVCPLLLQLSGQVSERHGLGGLERRHPRVERRVNLGGGHGRAGRHCAKGQVAAAAAVSGGRRAPRPAAAMRGHCAHRRFQAHLLPLATPCVGAGGRPAARPLLQRAFWGAGLP